MSLNTYRQDRGKYHVYYLDGERVTGVTTFMSKGLPKNLIKWASETVGNYAIDHWADLDKMPPSQRLKTLTSAPYNDRDGAAVRGSRIHDLAWRLGLGESVTIPADIEPQVQGCAQFHKDWDIHVSHSETAVFSRKYQYGGTFDLMAQCGDGKRRLLDYKSNRSGVWGEAALQLAAYRYADFYLDDRGEEQELPEVDECAIVWLPPGGGYQVVPMTVTPTVFDQFLSVKAVAEALPDIQEYAGHPLERPVTILAEYE